MVLRLGGCYQANAGDSAVDRFLGVVPNRAVHVLGRSLFSSQNCDDDC